MANLADVLVVDFNNIFTIFKVGIGFAFFYFIFTATSVVFPPELPPAGKSVFLSHSLQPDQVCLFTVSRSTYFLSLYLSAI